MRNPLFPVESQLICHRVHERKPCLPARIQAGTSTPFMMVALVPLALLFLFICTLDRGHPAWNGRPQDVASLRLRRWRKLTADARALATPTEAGDDVGKEAMRRGLRALAAALTGEQSPLPPHQQQPDWSAP